MIYIKIDFIYIKNLKNNQIKYIKTIKEIFVLFNKNK